MLIDFHDQTVGGFLIPSFTLSEGDIVVIQLPNGPYFYPLSRALIELFTGKTSNKNVQVFTPLSYAEHVQERGLWYRLFPLTVGAWLDKTANQSSPFYKEIYKIAWMKPKIKVSTLAGTVRRKLSIYSTLSWTKNIVFDLPGVDPQGGQEIYRIVKAVVQSGGAAILLDAYNEFESECATFIKAVKTPVL